MRILSFWKIWHTLMSWSFHLPPFAPLLQLCFRCFPYLASKLKIQDFFIDFAQWLRICYFFHISNNFFRAKLNSNDISLLGKVHYCWKQPYLLSTQISNWRLNRNQSYLMQKYHVRPKIDFWLISWTNSIGIHILQNPAIKWVVVALNF